MSRSPADLVSRVLRHLSNQSQKLCWSGTDLDRQLASVTWWTVSYAWDGAATPAEQAWQHVMGEQLAREAELLAELKAYDPPSPETEAFIEGRNGREWVRSIVRFLEWRIASAAKELIPERLQEELTPLTTALWLVHQSSSSNAPVHLKKEDACDLRRIEDSQCAVPADVSREHARPKSRPFRTHSDGGRVSHCRSWEQHRRTDLRATRGDREETEMSPKKLSAEYRELAGNGVSLATLTRCLEAKLASGAKKQYGRIEVAAVALNISVRTVDRWAHRHVIVFQEQSVAMVGRIAEVMLAQKKTADEAIADFKENLCLSALQLAGDKNKAAVLLSVHRNVLSKFTPIAVRVRSWRVA